MLFFKKILPLSLTLLLACGCSQKDFGERHHHYTLGTSICVPSNWKRIELSPEADLTSMAFEDGQGEAVVLTQNYEKSLEKQLEMTSQMNHPVLDSGPVLFSKYKTSWLLSDKDKTTNMTYVLKDKKARIFSIVCTAPSINFVSYRALFEEIAKSFRSY